MIEIRHPDIDSQNEERQAYDRIYADQGIRHLDSLYLWIISLLGHHPGQTLLDVSTGEGTLVHCARRQGLLAFGVDFSFAAVKKGALDYRLKTIALADAERLPLADGGFDFVTNVGSLEHYLRPDQAVHEMSRVLKPEGIACVLLPNTFSLFGNIKHVWRHGDVFDDGQPLQRYDTRHGWHRLLALNGLQPFRVVGYERERPLTLADWIWYLRRPGKAVHMLIAPVIPVNLANSLVYLCHPSRK